MSGLDKLDVDLSVVLGQASMTLGRFLKLGRGSVITLDTGEDDRVDIRANGHLIGQGEVAVSGGRIAVAVTSLARKPTVLREPGTRLGALPAPIAL